MTRTMVPCNLGVRAEPAFPIGATILLNGREAVVDSRHVDYDRRCVEYRVWLVHERREATIPAAPYPLADTPRCSCCGAYRIRVVPVLRSGEPTGRHVCSPCADARCTLGPAFQS